MNALTTTRSSSIAKPTTPALSPELQKLLDSDGSPDQAAQQIANTPALREEAQAALPALRALAEHLSGEEGVFAVVSRRFGTLGKPNLSEAEWKNWWADYYDACADLPLAALEAGMRAWVNNPEAEFIPKPGKLRELAERAPSQTLRRYQRAKRAIQMADEPPPEPKERADPGEVRALLADFQGKSLTHAAKPQLPSISGKPDSGGLTPEMRELIARRQDAQ